MIRKHQRTDGGTQTAADDARRNESQHRPVMASCAVGVHTGIVHPNGLRAQRCHDKTCLRRVPQASRRSPERQAERIDTIMTTTTRTPHPINSFDTV
jgi:hypothetical protein